MCDIVFEKAKGRGWTINKKRVFMVKQPSAGFYKKDVMRNFAEFTKKKSVPESLFWCFLVNFTEFLRTPFLQNSFEQLLLIIAVSIVAKGVLANETVNYDTQTKTYVLI